MENSANISTNSSNSKFLIYYYAITDATILISFLFILKFFYNLHKQRINVSSQLKIHMFTWGVCLIGSFLFFVFTVLNLAEFKG